jgi:hypothetical protein
MTRKPKTAPHGAWKQSLTYGSRSAVPPLCTVRHIATPKPVPLNHSFEASTLGDSNNINEITDFKD